MHKLKRNSKGRWFDGNNHDRGTFSTNHVDELLQEYAKVHPYGLRVVANRSLDRIVISPKVLDQSELVFTAGYEVLRPAEIEQTSKYSIDRRHRRRAVDRSQEVVDWKAPCVHWKAGSARPSEKSARWKIAHDLADLPSDRGGKCT